MRRSSSLGGNVVCWVQWMRAALGSSRAVRKGGGGNGGRGTKVGGMEGRVRAPD
jgi:hypothetical protein